MSVLTKLRRAATVRRVAVVATAVAVAAVPLTVATSSASAKTQALSQCQQVLDRTVNSGRLDRPAAVDLGGGQQQLQPQVRRPAVPRPALRHR